MAEQTDSYVDEEMMEELRMDAEDDRDDAIEEQIGLQADYPAPTPEERNNAHNILNKAMFVAPDTIKTTFLTEPELGRPLFSVRFLMDMFNLAEHYGAKRVSGYFWDKIQNVTASGMSNKGFAMNLNVTQKRDTTRKRLKIKEVGQNETRKARS